MKVQVIGLGTVGLPTALHISKFFETVGYDISMEAAAKAARHGLHVEHSITPADVYVVTVSTGLKPNGEPDMSEIYDVCGKIATLNRNALISIESTVSVGTCRKVAEKFGLKHVVHCPHRYWAGDPVKHGVVQTRVLGALNEESLEKGKRFYSELGIPVHIVSSIEVAELSKIAENAYRFVQIAFAEELKMICDKVGVDFNEVREACNTKWNVEILEARDGIGGHCLPKDIRYLKACAHATPLLSGAIEADRLYRRGSRWKESML
jgi:UDP-N-acetyl-D-mannosaminuronic acid dehydrogenase